VSFTVLENCSLPSVGLFSTCPSACCPLVYFLPAGPFPVLWSVSFSSVCFQPLSVLRIHLSISVCLFPCQSVCFLFIVLFPNCRSISRPSVCFRTVGSVSYPSPGLPVNLFSVRWSFPNFSVCFPVRQNRTVFYSSVSFKLISRANYRDHTRPLFAKHGILPIESLIHYYRVKFMHSYYFKKLPISFAELWLLNSERSPDRVLRNANEYYIPQPRIELVKRVPLFSFPPSWNSESDEKFIPSEPTFLKSL
jgi:hypothetical protein